MLATCPSPPAGGFAKDPLLHPWNPATPLSRCHPDVYGPTEFYAGRPGGARFSAFTPSGASQPLPVLYAAGTVDGALSETVLHEVPVRGPDKRINRSDADGLQISMIAATRELRLADLTSEGLSRLGVSRLELIESDRVSYPVTAEWARAIHGHHHSDGFFFDGLTWVSRQHDTSLCVVLFGDRVTWVCDTPGVDGNPPASGPPDIDLVDPHDPLTTLPLSVGAGKEFLDSICDRADITIVDP